MTKWLSDERGFPNNGPMTDPHPTSHGPGMNALELEAAAARLMIWVDHCLRCRREHGHDPARARTARHLLQAAIRQELTHAGASACER